MRKKIKILLIALFSVFLIITISTFVLFHKQNNKKTCPNFDLNEVLQEINLVTNNSFLLSNSEIFLHIPINISFENNYIFAYNEKNSEYFILLKDLDEKSIAGLKEYVDTNNKLYPENNIKFGQNEVYSYIISSSSYDSVIEGIIRSYIYC